MLADVTNKKTSSEKDKKSRFSPVDSENLEPFLAALVQSSDDAIIGKALDGTITSWNIAAEKMYGYSAEEIIGKPVSLLVPVEGQKEFSLILEKIKKDQRIEHFETTRLSKYGRIINVSVTLSPIKNKEGRLIGISKIARNITEKKKSEQERIKLASIVESSEDAILGMNEVGIIDSWNTGAVKMFGYLESEIIGKSVQLIYPSERADELSDIIKKLRSGQRIEHFETQRKRKDGTIIDVSLSISPIKNEMGEIIGIAKIIRDISGQKRVAQYARSLIEASVDPLVTISPEGKITDVNEATVRVTGVPRETLIGSDFSNYFTEPEKAREGYRQVFLTEKVTDYPLTIRHVSGKLTDVLYNASVYKDQKGNVLGVFAAARDVTERKKAEEQLHITSAYARSLIEASLDPLVTISPEGKITDVNDATVRITGVPRETLIGSDFSNFFTEPEEAREGYERVFKQGFVIDYPLAIRHATGQITDVLYNATVYKDDKGKVRGVFAAARDVTERKKIEEQLHATSAYARSLIESSLDPLVTISPEGKITDVNHATELITGVSREWLIGTDFSNYFTDPRQARQGYRLVFKEGAVRDYPLAIRHATGQITDVLYNATVYKDDKGKVRGVFAAARDVTETKKVTQYTRSLIEASLDPLVTISPEGKITDVNDATVRITGVPRENLIGTDFSNYFTEPQKARDGYEQVFKEGYVRDYPLTIHSQTGKLTDVLYNATVYKDEKGNVLGVFAAARDHTRVKRTTEELEHSNKELEAFSYSISHDLRAPLRSIDGFSKILYDEYAQVLDTKGVRYIDTIRTNAQKMSKLIDDLLTFSHTGRTDVKLGNVDMHSLANSVIAEIVQETNRIEPQRNLQYNVQNIESINVDQSLLRQVWVNLIGNAVKFSRFVNPSVIEIGSHVDGNNIIYYIKDNGVGFDMKYVNKIFTVFERLHDTKTFEGTGVGLAIVHNIIKRHGGKVWATGEVGKGAQINFSLPTGLTAEVKANAK